MSVPAPASWLSRSERRVLWALLGLGAVTWIVIAPASKVPLTVDEGQHLVGARHILLDSANLVRHHRYVGGHPDWPELARTYWTYPPTIDALYACFLSLFGIGSVAHGLPLLMAGWLAAASLFHIGRRLLDPDAGLLGATLLLWSRAALDQGTEVECEPFVAALGIAATAAAVEGVHVRRLRYFALAGVLGGLAYLFKLWLVFPTVLALGALGLTAEGWPWSRRIAVVCIMGACFMVVGSLHLAFIAAVAPGDLPLWQQVYTNALVRSTPTAADKPPWYYAAIVYQDLCVYALPLLWGAASLWLPARHARTQLVAIVCSALISGLVLNTSGAKESLYIFALTPPLILWVVFGLRGIAMGETCAQGSWTRRSLWLVCVASALLAAAVLSAWLYGKRVAGLDGLGAIGHAVVMAGVSVAVLSFGLAGWRPKRLVLALCVLGSVWGGVAVAQRLRDQARAALPEVVAYFGGPGAARPQAPGSSVQVFKSPYWLPLSYYTWQRGGSWVDPITPNGGMDPASLTDSLQWAQLDAEYEPSLGAPATPAKQDQLLRYLRGHMVEVSESIPSGHRTRVFVRRVANGSHPGAIVGGDDAQLGVRVVDRSAR